MDRKGIIAIALSLVTVLVWLYFNNQEMSKMAAQRARQQAAAAEQAKLAQDEAAKKAGTADATAAATPAAPAAPAAPTTPVVPEQVETLTTDSVEYTFSSRGGGIAKALLKKHEAERGTRMVINEFGDIPIGAISEVAGEQTGTPFAVAVDREAGKVTFDGTDARQLHVTKSFVVSKSTDLDKDYNVGLSVVFENRSPQPITIPAYFIHTGSAAPVHQRDYPYYTGFKWAGGKFIDVTWFGGGMFKQEQSKFSVKMESIAWAAVADQYFTTLITPRTFPGAPQPESKTPPEQPAKMGTSAWATRFAITNAAWEETKRSSEGSTAVRYGIEGALGMPGFTLAPGQTQAQDFRIYAGPREYNRLRLMPDGATDVLGFSDLVGLFSFLGPFVGFFSKVLLFSLNFLHAYVGSYAIAIIVLTLIIKAMLWPMQNKATQSMKRMQLLQPKMTELREKYADDPTRMNTEIMKLYKDYGVNPVGGCLPAFVQMPIFFGFYNMLGKAVELRNSKFLWVQDLSLPDTVFHLPGLGYPVNILPLCMAATMLWQMSAAPKTGDPTQQKLFMFMPLIFVMFCYNYASALALYLTVQNLISVVQLYVTRNQAPPTLLKPPPRKRK